MEFAIKQWIGKWDNFENYIDSTEPAMIQAWEEAEAACAKMPGISMFAGGARRFWKQACRTKTAENPVRLSGWEISPDKDRLMVRWLGEKGQVLAICTYEQKQLILKGLEGKENFLFYAPDAPEHCPFRCLLSMAPMPEREMLKQGGYLSHLHYQYASSPELLLQDGKLKDPGWYATMCAAEGTLLDRCNVVRGLHRLPLWTELPGKP